MDLGKFIRRFYFDMVTSELRYMSDAPHTPNITYNSILYLDMIAYRENCTVSFLAESLNVAKSAVTLKVNELVKQGLVAKTQSETDKRVFYLSITGKMTEEYAYYSACINSAVSEIEKQYSAADMIVFAEILTKIGRHFAEGIGYYDTKQHIPKSDES